MNIHQADIFVHVVRCGNFSNAAKKMYLSQPAVSTSIDQLERELNTQLFIRQGRKALLTESGTKLYRYALEMIHLHQLAIEDVAGTAEESSGCIRMIASFIPGIYLLPRFLKGFRQVYPNISFEIAVENTADALAGIINNDYDLAFVGSRTVHDSIIYHKICTDEMILITPNLPIYQTLENPVALAEMLDFDFIVRADGSATRDLFSQALNKRKIPFSKIRTIAEINSGEGVLQCVRNGLGVSVVSRLSYEPHEDLLAFDLADDDLQRSFYMIHNRSQYISPCTEKLIRYIKDNPLPIPSEK